MTFIGIWFCFFFFFFFCKGIVDINTTRTRPRIHPNRCWDMRLKSGWERICFEIQETVWTWRFPLFQDRFGFLLLKVDNPRMDNSAFLPPLQAQTSTPSPSCAYSTSCQEAVLQRQRGHALAPTQAGSGQQRTRGNLSPSSSAAGLANCAQWEYLLNYTLQRDEKL